MSLDETHTENNGSLFDSVDARASLAGSNKLEILLFSLGTQEKFGINVFKVKEVCRTQKITWTPNLPFGVSGIVSLRGHVIPVIDMASFLKLGSVSPRTRRTMMVTEYSRHTLGFLVHDVDRIVRVDWNQVHAPENMFSSEDNMITAITELPDGGLVSILDVEQILATAFGEAVVADVGKVERGQDLCVFFVDDSAVARKKISEILDKMDVKQMQATNGREAWERLQGMADAAQSGNTSLHDKIQVILVDAEMPEMDGYVLTQHIKADKRFEGIPVVMHSSLSSQANRAMGSKVGVDHYVAKFDAPMLAETLRPLLA
jgi:two-component system, chemotaxis family, chemotaxis protein CheV